MTLWAATKVCLSKRQWQIDWDTNCQAKAWVIVNTINLSLTERSTTTRILDWMEDQIDKIEDGPGEDGPYVAALFRAVSESTTTSEDQNLISLLWDQLYQFNEILPLLKASIAMLEAGIAIAPDMETVELFSRRAVIWPGSWTSESQFLW
jgi:hypothetical protein